MASQLKQFAIYEACEKQDWAALRQILPPPSSFGAEDANVLAGGDNRELFAAAPPHRDPETGLTALHWLVRYAQLTEADFIAPVVAALGVPAMRSPQQILDGNGAGPVAHLAYNTSASSSLGRRKRRHGRRRDAQGLEGREDDDSAEKREYDDDAFNDEDILKGKVADKFLVGSVPQAIVAELCRLGFSLDAKDASGATPLHTAVLLNNAPVVAALLWGGADLHQKQTLDVDLMPQRDQSHRETPKAAAAAAALEMTGVDDHDKLMLSCANDDAPTPWVLAQQLGHDALAAALQHASDKDQMLRKMIRQGRESIHRARNRNSRRRHHGDGSDDDDEDYSLANDDDDEDDGDGDGDGKRSNKGSDAAAVTDYDDGVDKTTTVVDEREDELPVELAEAFLVACLRYEQQEQLPAVSNVADSSAISCNSSLSALAASTLDQPDSLRIDIAIVSAAGLAKGDLLGRSDPYVCAFSTTGGSPPDKQLLHRTRTVKFSQNPAWTNESFTINLPSSSLQASRDNDNDLSGPHGLLFCVFDADNLSRDDFLGQAELSGTTLVSLARKSCRSIGIGEGQTRGSEEVNQLVTLKLVPKEGLSKKALKLVQGTLLVAVKANLPASPSQAPRHPGNNSNPNSAGASALGNAFPSVEEEVKEKEVEVKAFWERLERHIRPNYAEDQAQVDKMEAKEGHDLNRPQQDGGASLGRFSGQRVGERAADVVVRDIGALADGIAVLEAKFGFESISRKQTLLRIRSLVKDSQERMGRWEMAMAQRASRNAAKQEEKQKEDIAAKNEEEMLSNQFLRFSIDDLMSGEGNHHVAPWSSSSSSSSTTTSAAAAEVVADNIIRFNIDNLFMGTGEDVAGSHTPSHLSSSSSRWSLFNHQDSFSIDAMLQGTFGDNDTHDGNIDTGAPHNQQQRQSQMDVRGSGIFSLDALMSDFKAEISSAASLLRGQRDDTEAHSNADKILPVRGPEADEQAKKMEAELRVLESLEAALGVRIKRREESKLMATNDFESRLLRDHALMNRDHRLANLRSRGTWLAGAPDDPQGRGHARSYETGSAESSLEQDRIAEDSVLFRRASLIHVPSRVEIFRREMQSDALSDNRSHRRGTISGGSGGGKALTARELLDTPGISLPAGRRSVLDTVASALEKVEAAEDAAAAAAAYANAPTSAAVSRFAAGRRMLTAAAATADEAAKARAKRASLTISGGLGVSGLGDGRVRRKGSSEGSSTATTQKDTDGHGGIRTRQGIASEIAVRTGGLGLSTTARVQFHAARDEKRAADLAMSLKQKNDRRVATAPFLSGLENNDGGGGGDDYALKGSDNTKSDVNDDCQSAESLSRAGAAGTGARNKPTGVVRNIDALTASLHGSVSVAAKQDIPASSWKPFQGVLQGAWTGAKEVTSTTTARQMPSTDMNKRHEHAEAVEEEKETVDTQASGEWVVNRFSAKDIFSLDFSLRSETAMAAMSSELKKSKDKQKDEKEKGNGSIPNETLLSKEEKVAFSESFRLFVAPENEDDPYVLLMRRFDKTEDDETITIEDFHTLAKSLGWHSLTAQEEEQFAAVVKTELMDLDEKENDEDADEDADEDEDEDEDEEKNDQEGGRKVGKGHGIGKKDRAHSLRPERNIYHISLPKFLSFMEHKISSELKLSKAQRSEFKEAFGLFSVQQDALRPGPYKRRGKIAVDAQVIEMVNMASLKTIMASLDLKMTDQEVLEAKQLVSANLEARRARGGKDGKGTVEDEDEDEDENKGSNDGLKKEGAEALEDDGTSGQEVVEKSVIETGDTVQSAAEAAAAAAENADLEGFEKEFASFRKANSQRMEMEELRHSSDRQQISGQEKNEDKKQKKRNASERRSKNHATPPKGDAMVDLPTGFRILAMRLKRDDDFAKVAAAAEAKVKAQEEDMAKAAAALREQEAYEKTLESRLNKSLQSATAALSSFIATGTDEVKSQGDEYDDDDDDDNTKDMIEENDGAGAAAKDHASYGATDGHEEEADAFQQKEAPSEAGKQNAEAEEAKARAEKREKRLRAFVEGFEKSSEASLEEATGMLRNKERQRLQHAARALKPLLMDLEEQLRISRKQATSEAKALEMAKNEREQASLSQMKRGASQAEDAARIAATQGFQAVHKAMMESSSSLEAFATSISAFGSTDLSAQNDTRGSGRNSGGEDNAGRENDYDDINHPPDTLLSVEDENTEDLARREAARAQAWAEDVTRDHLVWYLSEFPRASYEDWVAAFAPENAREFLAGKSSRVDHRFYFPNAAHLRLWNTAMGKDPINAGRIVQARNDVPGLNLLDSTDRPSKRSQQQKRTDADKLPRSGMTQDESDALSGVRGFPATRPGKKKTKKASK